MATNKRHNGRILISILNWNGLPNTLACLSGLGLDREHAWDVVVIDNGSAEDPSAVLLKQFPTVECVRLTHNYGFTGGQNYGMQLALDRGYEAVMLLNNDCAISDLAMEELLTHLRSHSQVAAVSPLIYCAENRAKPQIVAAWFDWAAHRSVRPSSPDVVRPAAMPTMLPGTALLLRCSVLEQIGLLDARYFAYYEDNDLSARIAAHGYRAEFCPAASAWHSSRSVSEYSAMAIYLSARNMWLFWRTHTPAPLQTGLFRHLLAQSLYEIALLKKAGAHAKCAAVVAGFWDAQRRRTGAPPSQMRSPAVLRMVMCGAPYLLFEFLNDPKQAMCVRFTRMLNR